MEFPCFTWTVPFKIQNCIYYFIPALQTYTYTYTSHHHEHHDHVHDHGDHHHLNAPPAADAQSPWPEATGKSCQKVCKRLRSSTGRIEKNIEKGGAA